jgi:formamidopyrimidine-DNA glycosylase
MPELPELIVVRDGLTGSILGQTMVAAESIPAGAR